MDNTGRLSNIERIVRRVVGDGAGYDPDDVVNTIMSDVEMWPAWYYQQLSGEERVDYGSVDSESNVQILEKAVRGYVNAYPALLAGDLESATKLIVSLVVNWQKWVPSELESFNYSALAQEEDSYNSVSESSYGGGSYDGIGEF